MVTREETEFEWRAGRGVILSFVGFDVGIGGFACEKPRYIKAEPDGTVGRVVRFGHWRVGTTPCRIRGPQRFCSKLQRLRNCKELAAMMAGNNYVGCCKADLDAS